MALYTISVKGGLKNYRINIIVIIIITLIMISFCGPAVIYIDHENCLRSMAKIWNSRSKSGAYVCGLKMLLQDLLPQSLLQVH